ncbi:MAG: hypothetical protein LBL58_19725, partial [Tannerellaceae bacterium]|nr:hypothetical protein [Tannerellaceae bacterium]
MDDKHLLNIINQILDLPNLTHRRADAESFGQAIMRIIYDEFRPIIVNAVILWNNQVNDTETPIVQDEYYPQTIASYSDNLFNKENIVRLNQCIYPISGSELVKNELFKSAIRLWDSVWALPIHNIHNDSVAVIVFLAPSGKIPLSKEQIDFLQKIISDAYNSKTSFLQNDAYSFLEQLSDFTRIKRKEKTLSNKYENLWVALEKYKENILHFSVWKIDDISKTDYNVIKEICQNFRGVSKDKRPEQNCWLTSFDKGRIIDYINELKQKGIENELKEGKETNLIKFIKSVMFSDNDKDKFTDEIGIERGKTLILYIPIYPIRHNETVDRINILCLYINNLQYTIFRNAKIMSIFSRKIYESLTLHNQLIRNDTIKEILEIQEKDEKEFYRKAANKLKEKSQCRDCYIYIKEKTEDYFKMIIGREDNKDTEESELESREIMVDNRKILLPLSMKILNDKEFCSFLEEKDKTNLRIRIRENRNYYHLYYRKYEKKPNIIYSAILIPIMEEEINFKGERNNIMDLVGLVLLVNKEIPNKKKEQEFAPFFSAHNQLIVSPCAESIYKHKLLRDATKRSDLILARIRHEIPREINLITQNVKEISDFFRKDKSKYSHLINVTDYTGLSGRRIELFTNLATLISFVKQDLLKQKILERLAPLELIKHINSMKDIFRAEAKENGVGIVFNENKEPIISDVSRFYQFAINNIIFNAIRYSRFGSCVYVDINEDSVVVTNYGMKIAKNEINKIFTEEYRGIEAKEYTKDGMGLGLFIAKEVVEAHNNHTLSCTSELLYDHNYYGIKSFFDFVDK